MEQVKNYLKTLFNSIIGKAHKELDFLKHYVEQLEDDLEELSDLIDSLTKNPKKKK